MAHGLLKDEEIAAIRAGAEREIADAIEFARNGTDPDPRQGTRDVYTSLGAA